MGMPIPAARTKAAPDTSSCNRVNRVSVQRSACVTEARKTGSSKMKGGKPPE